jgi:hypothetical protein
LVLAVVPALWALDNQTQQDKTAREQFKSIVDEFQKQQNEFIMLLQKAKTPEEQKLALEKRPDQQAVARRIFEIAEKNPKDEVAFDALLMVLQLAPGAKEGKQAVDQITANHITNPQLGKAMPILSRLAGSDKIMETALEKNPSRDVKGLACFYLATYFKNQSERMVMVGKERKPVDNAAELLKQAEAMFERVVKEYGDVKDGKTTLAEASEPSLFEIRFLSVGKTAPDIEADDLDGTKFKLSDYRGKVVLLDFWGHW